MTSATALSLTVSAVGLLCLPAPLALPSTVVPDAPARRSVTITQRRAGVVAVGVFAVGLLLALWPWWFGLALAGGVGMLTLRLPERRSASLRAADRGRLAVHADLVAACLDAGMSIGAALVAVRTVGGDPAVTSDDADDPLHVLDSVAALLTLGADPQAAWRSAAGPSGSRFAGRRRSPLGGRRRGLCRSGPRACEQLARSIGRAAERSAGRAGVAMTAPLGLCFLPAFLCLGLAPVVVGLLSTLHLF